MEQDISPPLRRCHGLAAANVIKITGCRVVGPMLRAVARAPALNLRSATRRGDA